MASEDNQKIIPFGKHKGKSLDEVQAFDPQYLHWLAGQDWFRDKFVVLHQTIINRGAEPEETPVHNSLQVLFLDDEFCLKIATTVGYDPKPDFEYRRQMALRNAECDLRRWRSEGDLERIEKIKKWELTPKVLRKFEEGGIDVLFRVKTGASEPSVPSARFMVEIKPDVGDDYPAVLRQINRLTPFERRDIPREWPICLEYRILFLERYTGTGATLDQFIAIFKVAGIAVVFRHHVEVP